MSALHIMKELGRKKLGAEADLTDGYERVIIHYDNTQPPW